ncbi:MAG: WG repeat-containing protein [Bacteroidales bacterium]|nr:WG repeat-containing protein [Bacteroidales bacterium]MDD6613241.1 WG repeat-containing protein [Bacteroidales bacterium]
MKKLVVVFAAVATALTFVSCDKLSNQKLSVEYLPFKLDEKDAWGLMGKDGKALFKDEFEGIISPSYNGVFAEKTKNGISLYTTSEKPELIKGCDNLKAVGCMSDGLIPIVRKGQRIEYVDKRGKTKFTLNPYKNKEIVSATIFLDGLARIETDEGKYGFINTDGKVVIDPKYNNAGLFSEGVCVVQKIEKAKDTLFVLINKSGKEIKKLPKDASPQENIFSGGQLSIKVGKGDNERCAFLDKKGEIERKLPKKVKQVLEHKDKYYTYFDEDYNVGLNNMKDETVIRAKYESMTFVGEKTFLVNKGDKWNLIDDEDNVLKTFEDYTKVMYFDSWDCLFGIDSDEKVELMNTKGEKISNEAFIFRFDDLPLRAEVTSDYFDFAAVADKLASYITESGIGAVKIGDSMMKWLSDSNPASYYGENSVGLSPFMAEIADINKCELFVEVGSKNVIAIEKYKTEYFYGYSFQTHDGYTFNKNSKVDAVSILLSLETEDKIKDVEKLVNILRDKMVSKGYKVGKQGTFACELSKGNKTLLISPMVLRDTPILVAELVLTSDRSAIIKTMEEIEKMYSTNKENYKLYEDNEDYLEFGTETAVETAVEEPCM